MGGASDPNEDLVVDGRYWNYVVKTVPNPFADYGDFEIVSGNEHGKFWIDPRRESFRSRVGTETIRKTTSMIHQT